MSEELYEELIEISAAIRYIVDTEDITVLKSYGSQLRGIANKIRKPWHIGTPTEEGEYLVYHRCDKNPYCTDVLELYPSLLSPCTRDGMFYWVDDDGEIIFSDLEVELWQKIELYKKEDMDIYNRDCKGKVND